MNGSDNHKDLIVIGSGPGGYVAAIRAAQLGMRVAVVEKDPKFGGTCLHRGCIPTKALLHTADVLEQTRHASKFGVDVAAAELNFANAQSYKARVVDKNAKGIEFLFRKNGVIGIRGRGRLIGANEIEVEGPDGQSRYRAKNILLATGSVPRAVPFAPVDGERVVNSDHILQLDQVPATLAVLGAGAVGVEFASIYNSFGSAVTLIELEDRLLPIEDAELSKELEKAFRRRKIRSLTGSKLESVFRTPSGVSLTVDNGDRSDTIEVEKLLVAVGRAPVTDDLGLEELGIQLDRGFVLVDEMMRTSVHGVYAIGDIVPTPQLAHVASAEGILAVEHMAGHEVEAINYDHVPSCTYCDPEVASVGLTEATAEKRGYDVEVGKFPFSALGKAGILGKTIGFVKVVRETRYDQVLGVQIIGPHATDLIAEAGIALRTETTTEEIIKTMHAHPTLAEGIAEAAHAALGEAIHF